MIFILMDILSYRIIIVILIGLCYIKVYLGVYTISIQTMDNWYNQLCYDTSGITILRTGSYGI